MQVDADLGYACVPHKGWSHEWTGFGRSGWQSYLDVTLGRCCIHVRTASEVLQGSRAAFGGRVEVGRRVACTHVEITRNTRQYREGPDLRYP